MVTKDSVQYEPTPVHTEIIFWKKIYQNVNSDKETVRNFSLAFLDILFALRGIYRTCTMMREQREFSGTAWGRLWEPLYLDAVLSVEVGGTQTGVETVAQALQQPHSREQLTFVLKQAEGG